MKKFVYQVKNNEYVGFEPFGDAWKQARAQATASHMPIYRLVIKGEVVKQEVLANGGCFLPVDRVKTENMLIF